MAVDTRDKRASAIGMKLAFARVFPNPSGAIGAADRAQMAFDYSGLFTADIGGGLMGFSRRRRRRGFVVLGLLFCLLVG